MNIKPEEKFEEWQKKAEEDRITAEIIIKENGPANPLCFHAQQMAEKYLKGYLVVHRKRFKKTHQLEYLLLLCEEIDSSFKNLVENAIFLSVLYPEIRYPGDSYKEFTVNECKKAFEAAKKIKEFVLDKIKSSKFSSPNLIK